MRFSLFALSALLALASGSATAQLPSITASPNPTSFVQDGRAYTWSVAHGATGGLVLSQGSNTEIVVTCSGANSGGMQARSFDPSPATQLRLRMNATVFRMRAVPAVLGGKRFVEGQGDLPETFFDALSTAAAVTIEYGDQQQSFQGPGKEVADHLKRYCANLADRATRDEG